MIGKVIAQDFVTTRRMLGTSVGIIALIVAVSLGGAALGAAMNVPVLSGLGVFAGIGGVIVITPVVMALLAWNYWRSMYGQEGYFTMALPVRGTTLVWGKTLYALAITFAALALTAVGAAAAAITVGVTQGLSGWDFLTHLLGNLSGEAIWFVLGAVVVQLVFTVLAGTALMSIGAQGRFNHLGFGAPVLGAVILYFVMQIAGFAAMLFVPLSIRVAGPNAGEIVAQGMFSEFMTAVATPGGQSDLVGLGIIFVVLIVGGALAWGGARAVDRHTSLR